VPTLMSSLLKSLYDTSSLISVTPKHGADGF
jgi:hypothetical protein